jgi:hypothetical protein
MTAEKSQHFPLTGRDPESHNRTISWQEAEFGQRQGDDAPGVLTLDVNNRRKGVLLLRRAAIT